MSVSIQHPTPTTPRALLDLIKKCEEIATADPGDTTKITALYQEISIRYYRDVLSQAQNSFYVACGAAVVGTLFFLVAVAYQMMQNSSASKFSLLAGALIQVISGINFYLYGKAARQFAGFHVCLERTNRYLLANTFCENLNCSTQRDKVRSQLIQTMANAAMLTLDVITDGPPQQQIMQTDWTTLRDFGSQSTNGAGTEVIEAHGSKVISGGPHPA